jgi:[citrate (pro-3S)-lyase] ligase
MPGDILMEINSYDPLVECEILRNNRIHDISDYYNLNCQSEKWEFLDNTFHVNSSVNKSIADYLIKFVGKDKGRAKQVQAHDNYFFTSGKISKLNPTWLLEKGLLNSYLTYLSTNKKILDDKSIIGSVIITANPITKGHEFLINEAKKQCDILYVFVVEEDRFFFSTTERLFMVKQTIKDPNIVVLTTGNLMTASFTFPEYFNKEHAIPQKDNKTIPQFHFQIFGTIVAPLLGINVRFIGSEIEDSVTDAYNKMLMKYLPPMGIKVILIPRLQTSDKQIISASTVRKYIESRNLDALSHYVSPVIMDLIQNKWDKKEY